MCDVALKSAGIRGRSQLCDIQCLGGFPDLRILLRVVLSYQGIEAMQSSFVMLSSIPFKFLSFIFQPRLCYFSALLNTLSFSVESLQNCGKVVLFL